LIRLDNTPLHGSIESEAPTNLYQEISNALMEKMAELSAKEDSPPLEAAQTLSILTYIPPYATEDVLANAIFIGENPRLLAAAGSTGLRTWDACLHLATYLASDGRSLIKGKSVLELGAGTGLLSIICAGLLSAAYVLATDRDEDMSQRIERNIGLNHHLTRRSGRWIPVEAGALKWGSSETLGRVLPSMRGNILYDTILGADLIYSLDSFDPLASTISALAELCPTAEIVISAPVRNEDVFDLFLARCLDHGLSVYDVDFRCPRFELQRGFFHNLDPPIRIVRIRRE
jgi:protein-lysine N-methyltransferase EEF2KMT